MSDPETTIFSSETPILEEYFSVIERGSVNYCIVCLRTEEERLLVRPHYFQQFVRALKIEKKWKHNHICKYCERQAYLAVRFLRAVEMSAAVDTVFSELLRQKKKDGVSVFTRKNFENILAECNVEDKSATTIYYEQQLQKIRQAAELRPCEIVVLDNCEVFHMQYSDPGLTLTQLVAVSNGRIDRSAVFKEPVLKNGRTERSGGLQEAPGSPQDKSELGTQTELTMDSMVINSRLAYERLTLKDPNPKITDKVIFLEDEEETPFKMRRMEPQHVTPCLTITPTSSEPFFGPTPIITSVTGNIRSQNRSPVKKNVKKSRMGDPSEVFDPEDLIPLRYVSTHGSTPSQNIPPRPSTSSANPQNNQNMPRSQNNPNQKNPVAGTSSNADNAKNPILTSLLNDANRQKLPPMPPTLNLVNPRQLPGTSSENIHPTLRNTTMQHGQNMGNTRIYSSPKKSSSNSLSLLQNIIPTFPKPAVMAPKSSNVVNPHNLPGIPSTSQYQPIASTSKGPIPSPIVAGNKEKTPKTVTLDEIIQSTIKRSTSGTKSGDGDHNAHAK